MRHGMVGPELVRQMFHTLTGFCEQIVDFALAANRTAQVFDVLQCGLIVFRVTVEIAKTFGRQHLFMRIIKIPQRLKHVLHYDSDLMSIQIPKGWH